MAKKLNQAERVRALLNGEKAKDYILKQTLYPAVLLGGTKTGSEERVQYRCAHCKHEWEKVYANHYSRHGTTVICPKCKAPMFPGVKIPEEQKQYSYSFQLWDGVQIRNLRYLLCVDAATMNDTQGLILTEYEPTVVYRYSDVPESFEVKLHLQHYGFISATHKILFNSDGIKTTKFLYMRSTDGILLCLPPKLLSRSVPRFPGCSVSRHLRAIRGSIV